MKCWAIVLLFLGLSLAFLARHDNVEGAYLVPAGIIIAIAGAIIYFEGLKREIIAALKDEPGKAEAGSTGGGNPQA
ncbi:MAG: hypothetical protein ACYSP9_04930 [Planctomycetota bacterium]|jgi:hypothetical protein